jgi:hypothetical protein
MKNKYEIVSMFANDFGKAFDFIRKEAIAECVEVVRAEPDIIVGLHGTDSLRQRMVDKMRRLGPIE